MFPDCTSSSPRPMVNIGCDPDFVPACKLDRDEHSHSLLLAIAVLLKLLRCLGRPHCF